MFASMLLAQCGSGDVYGDPKAMVCVCLSSRCLRDPNRFSCYLVQELVDVVRLVPVEMVDFPVPWPWTRQEIAEAMQAVLVERIKDRIAEQGVNVSAPPVLEEIVAVVQKTLVPPTMDEIDRSRRSLICRVRRWRSWQMVRLI